MIVSQILRRSVVWTVAALASLAWCVVTYGLVRHAMSTDWISSFVEIAFALNASLTIDKARKFFLKPFANACYARVQEVKLHAAGTVSEQTIKDLSASAKSDYERFEARLKKDLCYAIRLGLVCAVGCVFALLIGSNESLMPFVPWLFLPVIFFAAGVVVEYLGIVTEFSSCCGKLIEDAHVQKEREAEKFMDSIVPTRESE